MNWSDIGSIIAPMAPTIGRMLGGFLPFPGGGLAGEWAGNLLAKHLGVEATPEAVADAVRAEPEAALPALKQADTEAAEEWARLAEIDAKDRESARGAMTTLVTQGSSIAWAPVVVSVLVTIGFIFVSAIAMLRPLGTDMGVVLYLLGVWATGFATAIAFWLGSSNGSQKKDATIGNFIERSAGPVGRAIESAVTKQASKR